MNNNVFTKYFSALYLFILTGMLLFFSGIDISEASILNTKHNLSASGPGPVKSASEKRVCIFCHTPKNPKVLKKITYIPYQSSTLYAIIGQPTGVSKLCLSCHDGTIALGAFIHKRSEIPFAGGIRFIPEGPAKLGNDLSDDHPVSFLYDTALALKNGELVDPSSLPAEIRLDSNEYLQCTACHDPHDDTNGKFLVKSNQFSALCTSCHEKNGWTVTSHSISNATWDGTGTNPWLRTMYPTVAENGCENCHMPHTAGGHERLLNYPYEEDNCLVCHNGNVSKINIEKEIIKPYKHAVEDYIGVHDPAEDFTSGSVKKHVECTDCHNPHWANTQKSPGAPSVSGAIEGVTGVTVSGDAIQAAQNQYEICFKCHADSNIITTVPIDRQIEQFNSRLEFNSSNPSYHPVVTQGVNTNVPSLRAPYTTSSIIFCSDCHNSDNAEGAAGPHGSNYEYLLERNYTTQDYTHENAFNYALCYKCHDRNSILNDESFLHRSHLEDAKAPCSACHDAHGISSTQGNSVNNSHLINFDITIVQPDSQGRLYFQDTGTFSGVCFLKCHNQSHEPLEYPHFINK